MFVMLFCFYFHSDSWKQIRLSKPLNTFFMFRFAVGGNINVYQQNVLMTTLVSVKFDSKMQYIKILTIGINVFNVHSYRHTLKHLCLLYST